MSSAIVYNSIFAQVSYQFCGHLDEYLIRHAKHLGLMYFPTRYGREGVTLRFYEEGRLVEELKKPMSCAVIPYYWQWWRTWSRELKKFSKAHDGTTAIFTHPLGGVGMSSRRNVRHVFWQWDYFPDGSLVSRIFNVTAKAVARKCWRYHPLTNAIGKAMGMESTTPVMLGVTVPERRTDSPTNRLLMVGQLRGGQGVEHVLDFIGSNPEYSLSLIGAAAGDFGSEISSRIRSLGIGDRVFFPNRFFTDSELREEAGKCFASLALYDTDSSNLTNYADPGKVKSSIEMGLPVVMTRISAIVPYVEKYGAGEVIDSIEALPNAVAKIANDRQRYQEGVIAFARHFDYGRYYASEGLFS